MKKILFVFLDGVGIGEEKDSNPFYKNNFFLGRILRELFKNGEYEKNKIFAKSLKAINGIEGVPQSATNQTTIFTGVDSVKYYGGHKSGFPDKKLKKLLKKESIFLKLKNLGLNAHFANGFTPEYFNGKRKRLSVTTLSAIYGGDKFVSIFEIPEKKCLFHDFTNVSLNVYGYNFPTFDTLTASKVLIDISKKYDFTLYEFFLTDIAGHSQDMEFASLILELLDAFLYNLFSIAIKEGITLLLTSDHGNIEDLSLKPHTKNNVPFIFVNGDGIFFEVENMADITPKIINFLIR